MSIREIRVFQVPLENQRSYTMSNSSVGSAVSTVVELVDADGTTGYGEACLASPQYQPEHNDGVRASLAILAPAILGLDPLRHQVVNGAMHAAMSGHPAGKAALDIACWDVAGKKLNRSVVDLLGGAHTGPSADGDVRGNRVLTYHVVGIGTPEQAVAEAQELLDAGHTRFQLKTGGRPIHHDIDSIRAVAGVLPPHADLAVDTNRGWTAVEAIQVSNACADIRMSMEQPCATEAELHQVKAQGRHPIVVDENATSLAAIARMISSGLADGFGLKLTRLGGLTPMRAVRDLCMDARVPMSSDDAWGGDIIAAASVALGATLVPQFSRGAWIAHPYHQQHYDENNGPRLDSGFVTLPEGGPGLGLAIEEGMFGTPDAVYR